MAFFLLNGSFSLNILTLIVLIFLCICSTCSSSRFFDLEPLNTDLNADSISYEYVPPVEENYYLPSRNELRNLLLQSIFYPSNSHSKSLGSKRYTSQGFHALRG